MYLIGILISFLERVQITGTELLIGSTGLKDLFLIVDDKEHNFRNPELHGGILIQQDPIKSLKWHCLRAEFPPAGIAIIASISWRKPRDIHPV
jgi:hypothetical protein